MTAFDELAATLHREINADPLLPDCSGTHLMGYAICQRLAVIVERHQEAVAQAAGAALIKYLEEIERE